MTVTDPNSPTTSDVSRMDDPPDATKSRKAHPSRVWATVRAMLRARVTAGLLLVLPIWITYLLVRFIFELMRDTSLWAVNWYLRHWGETVFKAWGITAEQFARQGVTALPSEIQWAVAIFSVFLTIFFLYLLGVMTANFLGRRLVQIAEGLLDRVPFVKTVYRASKQILRTFAGDSDRSFQRVALIPFPNKETRSIGFITGITRESHTGEELCTVFVATTPNPTTGYVFILRRADVIEMDWTVEEAIKVLISGGVLVPPTIPMVATSPAGAVDRAAVRSKAVSGTPSAVTESDRAIG